MYNRSFFRSQLGQAALASMAAMATFVLLSSQIAVTAPPVADSHPRQRTAQGIGLFLQWSTIDGHF